MDTKQKKKKYLLDTYKKHALHAQVKDAQFFLWTQNHKKLLQSHKKSE